MGRWTKGPSVQSHCLVSMYIHAVHSQAVVVATLCAVGVVFSFSEAVCSLAGYTRHNTPFQHSIEDVDDNEFTEVLFGC